MEVRSSLVTGRCSGSLALFGLGCDVEDHAGEELMPDNGLEDNDDS